jgi:glycosyltransferase involved in cell wall biosynthesis
MGKSIERIAYLSTFYPFRGGITQFNNLLIKALSEKHACKAYTFKRQYPDLLFPGKTQYVTENDIVEKTHAERILDTVNPISYCSSAKKIRAFEPDLLIMKYWMSFFGPSLGTVAGKLKKKAVKVISILDNVIPHESRFFDKAFTRYFLQRNSGFVVMSNTVKEDLLILQPEAKYVFHSHPLYDHFGSGISKEEARKKLSIPTGKKNILFFGFIRAYKGLDMLIEAMDILGDDYYLIIAGEVYGQDQKYLDLIEKHQLRNKVQAHLRYIEDHEVPLFFSAADVHVLPYTSATQSGILSIAYHFELPVIVTDTGSLREAVEPYNNGLIIEDISIQGIAAMIKKYFSENKEEYYRQNIRDYKKQNSWASLAETIITFAENLD